MSALYALSHHDREDAIQNAWIAAAANGRADDPRYLAGCRRHAALEVMRQNDKWRRNIDAWRVSNLPAARTSKTLVAVGDTETYVVPRYTLRYRNDVLYGEAYREYLRVQARARKRKATV